MTEMGARLSGPATRLRRTKKSVVLFIAAVGIFAAACTNDIVPKGGWSGPVEFDGYLYFGTGGSDGKLMRVSAESGLLDPTWQYPAGEKTNVGAIYGSPVVLNGIIHAAGYSCRGNICEGDVFAVDPETGQAAWAEGGYSIETKLAGQLAAGTDTIVFGTSKVGKGDSAPGYLYALDPEVDAGRGLNASVAARRKWRIAVDGPVLGSPVVDADIAYFGTMNRTFYAVDLTDDEDYVADPEKRILWTFQTEGAMSGVPYVRDGKVIFGDFENRLYALSLAVRKAGYTGAPDSARGEWVFTGEAWFWGSPVADATTIYASTVGGQVYALDIKSGVPKWDAAQQVEGQVVGALVLIDSQRGAAIGIPVGKKNVAVLRASDGLLIGELFTDQPVKSAPTVSGDFVFIHTLKGQFYTFSAKSFEQRTCVETKKDGERCES